MTDESVTLDPVEFVPERVELGLDKLGIKVREAKWGDSEHELFLVRQALGEIPADRHPPNRTAQFKLMVEEDKVGGLDLAQAAIALQQKVGLHQKKGGWARRDLDTSSGFVGPVAAHVRGAALAGLDGWMMAHRKRAPEVDLTLTIGPYLYGVTELPLGEFLQASGQDLIFSIPEIKGSAPGLIRFQIKNEMGLGEHWRTLWVASESDNLPTDGTESTTAQMAYEAEDLTMVNGGEATVDANASGGKRAIWLTPASFQTLLKSNTKFGPMTHVGSRKVWIRVKLTSTTQRFKLRWRQLGAPFWIENKEIELPKTYEAGYYYLDLGEVRLDNPVLGNKGWEWDLLGEGDVPGVSTMGLDRIYFLPTEQYAVAHQSPIAQAPELEQSKEATAATGNTGSGAAWINPTNAFTSNNTYATSTIGVESQTAELRLSNYGFTVPAGSTIVGIVAEIERKSSSGKASDYLIKLIGSLGLTIGEERSDGSTSWPTVDTFKTYGGSQDLWGNKLTPNDVNSANFGLLIQAFAGFIEGATCSVDAGLLTVYYSELEDQGQICFQTRRAELRSEGMYRQHPTTDNWGRIVPDGFLPVASPSGLEAQPMRTIVIPSTGDLAQVADLNKQKKLSVQGFYHPGYHFTSEGE